MCKNEAYEAAKVRKKALESACDAASAALKPFPRNAMGLTPDDVKSTPAYREAAAAYAVAFAELRRFNEAFLKRFAAEYRAERRHVRGIER